MTHDGGNLAFDPRLGIYPPVTYTRTQRYVFIVPQFRTRILKTLGRILNVYGQIVEHLNDAVGERRSRSARTNEKHCPGCGGTLQKLHKSKYYRIH